MISKNEDDIYRKRVIAKNKALFKEKRKEDIIYRRVKRIK